MNKEELITTYKEYEETMKKGIIKPIKGLGRMLAYQGLDYLKKFLENNYSETLEDSIVAIISYINWQEKVNNQLETNRDEVLEIINTQVDDFESDRGMWKYYIEEIKKILERGSNE